MQHIRCDRWPLIVTSERVFGEYRELTAQKAVHKIAGPESAGNQRRDPSTVGGLYAHIIADMCEHVGVTHRDKHEFTKVRVCTEIFESVHLQSKYVSMSQPCKGAESLVRTACPRRR